jgi:hypothetical protein
MRTMYCDMTTWFTRSPKVCDFIDLVQNQMLKTRRLGTWKNRGKWKESNHTEDPRPTKGGLIFCNQIHSPAHAKRTRQ